MSVNDSINRIVTGSGVILAGTFIGMLLDIITKKVLTSHLSPADFGTYALALTVISITGAVATLGLNEGVPRYIAFFRGRHEEQKIHEVIISAMLLGLIAGLLSILVSPSLFHSLAESSFDAQGKNSVRSEDPDLYGSIYHTPQPDSSDLQRIRSYEC